MADIVRLAIVYDTSQAAAAITDLDRRLSGLAQTTTRTQSVFTDSKNRWASTSEIMASMSASAARAGESLRAPTARVFSLSQAMNGVSAASEVSTHRLQQVAISGIRLAGGLNAGNLSAMALARSASVLAGATAFGAVLVSVINVINALQEYKRVSEDVTRTIDNMQTSARDARKDVARLLGEAPAESPAERAIKRLRDAAAQMRGEAARIGGAAGDELKRQADVLELEIPSIGARAAKMGARKVAQELADYNRNLERQNYILGLLNAGPMEVLTTSIDLARKEIVKLVEDGWDPMSKRVQGLVSEVLIGTDRLNKMKHAASLLNDGLQSLSTMIEDFVVTGTLAFEDFLNNILRLLYRDFSQDIIGGLIHSAVPGGTAAPGGSGGVEVLGNPGGGISGSITAAPVNFNISTMDAQGVAQFINTHGAAIAAEVTRQAGRSAGLRRAFRRG